MWHKAGQSICDGLSAVGGSRHKTVGGGFSFCRVGPGNFTPSLSPNATIYVVAEPEVEKAIEILRTALIRPLDEYEDLGRVSDTLLNALSLQPGQFSRT